MGDYLVRSRPLRPLFSRDRRACCPAHLTLSLSFAIIMTFRRSTHAQVTGHSHASSTAGDLYNFK